MSTSLTRLGGVVVITQVIQQGEASIPLHSVPCGSQATPTTAPALPPAGRLVPPAHTKLDELSASFLQGMPQGLGVSFLGLSLLAVLLQRWCCDFMSLCVSGGSDHHRGFVHSVQSESFLLAAPGPSRSSVSRPHCKYSSNSGG